MTISKELRDELLKGVERPEGIGDTEVSAPPASAKRCPT